LYIWEAKVDITREIAITIFFKTSIFLWKSLQEYNVTLNYY